MLTGRLWISGTTLLIGFIAYSPQIAGFFYSTPFNVAALYLFYNYFQTVRTDPGSTPADWQPLQPTSRYCKKCDVSKPPRAHHCRYCKHCVLRYDHHCPWVDNCVGLRNYPYFLRFLLAVDVCCASHLYLLTTGVLNEDNLRMLTMGRLERGVTTWHIVTIVANYVACIPVLVAVGLFSLYHFWNLASNTTTIEGTEIERTKKMIKRGKIQYTPFPFGVGIVANITAVLGNGPMEWLFTGKPSSDGLIYPSVDGSDPSNWPPRDPFDTLKETWAMEASQHSPSLSASFDPRRIAVDANDTDSELRRFTNDDDIPLAHLAHRNVRLRRGSEGFEVRPMLANDEQLDESSSDVSEPTSDGTNWNELYERKELLYDSASDDE